MLLNLNADLGESFGAWSMGDDQNLLQVVNSANVACGFHAGDPLVMRNTVKLAKESKVSIGAHPGFPDLQGFGRRTMNIPNQELSALIQYQLAALDGMSRAQGHVMTHVKPHGALNNMACEDAAMAEVVVDAIKSYRPDIIFLAPVLSELAKAASAASMRVALEVFADRAYTDTGTLVSRREPGAVLATANECIAHVKAMIEAQGIISVTGKVLPTPFHSICVHGDNAHAVETASLIKQALVVDGHELVGLPEMKFNN